MDVRDAIIQIMTDIKGMTQADIARRANVQRPQLNIYIKKKSSLPEDSQKRIATAILDKMAELGKTRNREFFYDYSEASRILTQFTGYNSQFDEKRKINPYQSADPSSPIFITRRAEKQLLSIIHAEPLWLSIVGGVKMGKSSMLRLVEKNLSDDENIIIKIDFSEFQSLRSNDDEAELFQWIAIRCEEQIEGRFPIRLKHGRDFPGWVSKCVVGNAMGKRCYFLFDNLHDLWRRPQNKEGFGKNVQYELADYKAFLQSLMAFRDETFDNPGLDRCGIICTIDFSHRVTSYPESKGVSSFWAKNSTNITLRGFSENDVFHIFDNLEIKSPNRVSNEAWRKYYGHPFLTLVYGLSNIDGKLYTEQKAWQYLCDKLRETWIFYDDVLNKCKDRDIKRIKFESLTNSGTWRYLELSGLFSWEMKRINGDDRWISSPLTEEIYLSICKYLIKVNHEKGQTF